MKKHQPLKTEAATSVKAAHVATLTPPLGISVTPAEQNLPAEKDIELPDGVEQDSPEAMEYRLRKLFGDEMEAARNRIHSLEKQAEHLAGQIEQFKAIAEECRTQARLAHDALAAVQETQSRLEPQNCTRAMASLAAGIIVLSNQSGHPLSGNLEHELTHLRDGKRL